MRSLTLAELAQEADAPVDLVEWLVARASSGRSLPFALWRASTPKSA